MSRSFVSSASPRLGPPIDSDFARVVERRRPVIVVTVFTGDPQHKVACSLYHSCDVLTGTVTQILVTALSPCSSLTPSEAQTEWDQAMRHLRSEGARPRDVSAPRRYV